MKKKTFSDLPLKDKKGQSFYATAHSLWEGVELSFITLQGDYHRITHEAKGNIFVINYCHRGRVGWDMARGHAIYLGEGDFSLHTLQSCDDSSLFLPNGYYEGMTIAIDLEKFSRNLPELLQETPITGAFLREKFCKDGLCTSLAGNEKTKAIFSFFYDQPKSLQVAYWKVKVLELLLYLANLHVSAGAGMTEYQSEQVQIIRTIHDGLLNHLDRRVTTEELAKQYHINPTTLKSVFKTVYGTSLASHMKEHRLHQAAELLLDTHKSIGEIAREVGYESQSKFSKAFKDYFNTLPTEYRSCHRERRCLHNQKKESGQRDE